MFLAIIMPYIMSCTGSFSYIVWDPAREIFYLPFFKIPIFWYSILFALGFLLGYFVFRHLLQVYFLKKTKLETKTKVKSYFAWFKKAAIFIADKTTIYMIIATILGARFGQVLFYENLVFYLKHPWEIFKIWQGGLASHGAAAAIIFAIWLLSRRLKKINFKNFSWKIKLPALDFLNLLDLIAPAVALAAVFIRLGNFFNQEILGVQTSVPWGILFVHPMDGSAAIVRHPVQLYEAVFYLAVFALLAYLAFKKFLFLNKGRLIGLFLILVFSFRFVIEFLKINESFFTHESVLLMGQYLSIPLVLLGFLFYFYQFKKK